MSDKNDVFHSARNQIGQQFRGYALHVEVVSISGALCTAARHVERDGSTDVAVRLLMKRRERFSPNPSALAAAMQKSEIGSRSAHAMRLVVTRTTDRGIDRTCQKNKRRDKRAASIMDFGHANPLQ